MGRSPMAVSTLSARTMPRRASCGSNSIRFAADYITVKLMRITREYLGRKITPDLAEAWINAIAFMLRDHKADNDILGYTPAPEMFRASQNSPENIRLGELNLTIGIEPAPVFKLANHEIVRYRPAVEGLVNDIVARLNAAA